MIDLNVLGSVVFSILDAASQRLPIPLVSKAVIAADKVENLNDLQEGDLDVLVRAVVLASDAYDIRAGRTGGAGKREWYKGGASAEPTGTAAKIAKRLRDAYGIDKADATRVVTAYLDALVEGDTEPLSDAEILRQFK